MAATTRNPAAGGGGARDRRAGRLDSPENSHTRPALQQSARVDELLFRLVDRLRLGRLDGWERDFARSILGQAKRRGPRFAPSANQLATMERIVARPADDGAEESLIEEIEEVGDDR